MSEPAWVEGVVTGLGALIAELERARDAVGVGAGETDAVDWPALVEKARGVGAKLEVATSDYKRIIAGANEKLASASLQIRGLHEHVQELQGQLGPPGVGAPKKTGLGAGQTVYISAGATAGIAAGALLLGGVGGYAAKAMLDKRKKKKAAEAKEAAAAEPEEEEEELEEKPAKRITRKAKT